jgi:hypothetical protein
VKVSTPGDFEVLANVVREMIQEFTSTVDQALIVMDIIAGGFALDMAKGDAAAAATLIRVRAAGLAIEIETGKITRARMN